MKNTITIPNLVLRCPGGAAPYLRNQAILAKIAEVNADIWVSTEN